jgi:hypothetical protein
VREINVKGRSRKGDKRSREKANGGMGFSLRHQGLALYHSLEHVPSAFPGPGVVGKNEKPECSPQARTGSSSHAEGIGKMQSGDPQQCLGQPHR